MEPFNAIDEMLASTSFVTLITNLVNICLKFMLITSVSYTHLDVYKRQECEQGIDYQQLVTNLVTVEPCFRISLQDIAKNRSCLLYTSEAP